MSGARAFYSYDFRAREAAAKPKLWTLECRDKGSDQEFEKLVKPGDKGRTYRYVSEARAYLDSQRSHFKGLECRPCLIEDKVTSPRFRVGDRVCVGGKSTNELSEISVNNDVHGAEGVIVAVHNNGTFIEVQLDGDKLTSEFYDVDLYRL